MEIRPIDEGVVKRIINQLDKQTPIDNPSSIFTNNESSIDKDYKGFIFNNLYQ